MMMTRNFRFVENLWCMLELRNFVVILLCLLTCTNRMLFISRKDSIYCYGLRSLNTLILFAGIIIRRFLLYLD